MFRSFRHRLMFWFFVFLSFSLLMLVHSLVFMGKREAVRETEDHLESVFTKLNRATEQGASTQASHPLGFFSTQGYAPSRNPEYRARMDTVLYELAQISLPPSLEAENLLEQLRQEVRELDALSQAAITGDLADPRERLQEQNIIVGHQFRQLLAATTAWRDRSLKQLGQTYLYIGLGLWLACILLGVWMAGQLTRPLRSLNRQLRDFVGSNFTTLPEQEPLEANDEFAELGRNFFHLQRAVREQMLAFKDKVKSRTEELADANDQLLRLAEANSRFVPDEFLDFLGKEGIEEVQLGDHVESTMTIMFTDIREFTQLSEAMDPQENFDFINTYLRGIVPIIQRHGGFIDKFIGDSVMALFPKSAEGAVRAAFAIEEFLQVFNRRLQADGRPPIRTATGIHTGHLILGTIGHANRLETTVISDAVNTAARVEGLSKHYQAKVVITEASLETLDEPAGFAYRFLDRVQVKGKRKAVEVYEFLSPLEVEKRSSLAQYNEAIGLIRERKIEAACRILEGLRLQYPEDDAIRIMSERCRSYLEDGDNAWEDITQIIA